MRETIPKYSEQDYKAMIKNAGAGNEVAIDWARVNGLNINEELAEQALDGDETAWRLLVSRFKND